MKADRLSAFLYRFGTLIFPALFIAEGVFAQNYLPVYRNTNYSQQQGYTTFGLNSGLSYLDADVTPRYNSYGFGATMAKNLIYSPRGWVAFDVRGRAMYSYAQGLDTRPSYGIKNNSAINGTNNNGLDYRKDSLYYANYKTEMAELGVEGVFTFNDMREETGIVFQLFAGIGLDWYQVHINQRDFNGALYSSLYRGIDRTSGDSQVKANLLTDLDGTYESFADGFSRFGKIGFMPNAGLEIGYMLSRGFYVSLSHKETFSRSNLLDGQQWNNFNVMTNHEDVHRYTSLGVHAIFGPRPSFVNRPFVQIISPQGDPAVVYGGAGSITAAVTNVRSGGDITVTLNNRPVRFIYANGTLNASVTWAPGLNEVVVSASNPAGFDNKRVTVATNQGNAPYNSNNNYPNNNPNVYPNNRTNPIPTNTPNRSNYQNPAPGYNANTYQNSYPRSYSAVTPAPAAAPPAGNQTLTTPVAKILSPKNGAIYVLQNNITIRAQVAGARYREDVQLYVQGILQKNFDFKDDMILFNFNLKTGPNEVRILIANNLGRSETVATYYFDPKP